MKTQLQLVNNVIGQLSGIKKMMESEEECFKVLVQIKAAKAALDSFTAKYLQENFVECVSKDSKNTEKICKKFFEEIIK
jgi:CsoR family transcriptional regulator, copper-sensing transcriptional repressor